MSIRKLSLREVQYLIGYFIKRCYILSVKMILLNSKKINKIIIFVPLHLK